MRWLRGLQPPWLWAAAAVIVELGDPHWLIAGFVLVAIMSVRTPLPRSSTAQLHSLEASHDQ
jgi:hypothetical protein